MKLIKTCWALGTFQEHKEFSSSDHCDILWLNFNLPRNCKVYTNQRRRARIIRQPPHDSALSFTEQDSYTRGVALSVKIMRDDKTETMIKSVFRHLISITIMLSTINSLLNVEKDPYAKCFSSIWQIKI